MSKLFIFHKKGWLKTLNMQGQNGLAQKRDNLWNVEQLNVWQNVSHVQCWQVHDDSLLKSRGITVDVGYVATDMKPDLP